MTASPPLIHVRATPAGTWRVESQDDSAPVSEHSTATEAERAAQRFARQANADVVVHDRYGRTRITPRRS
jgi:uncharacterized protein DUF2188